MQYFSFPSLFWKICGVAVLIRIIFSLGFSNLHSENYWEYGHIGKNILHGKGYSYFYSYNGERYSHFSPTSSPYPSAYMMPGYVVYLLPFLTIKNVVVRNISIIFSHIIVVVLTLGLYFHFVRIYFSEKIAVLSLLIISVLPDFIYAVISFTPTVVFHCGIIVILIILSRKKSSNFYSIMLGITLALMVYFRSEIFLLVMLLALVLAMQKEWKKAIIVISTVVILLTPWIYRNYVTFHSFVPFTTTLGLNLYRGNNPIEIGAWGDERLIEAEKLLPQNEQYEIAFNNMYLKYTIDYIKEYPFNTIKNIPLKLFDLWIFDRHYEMKNLFYSLYSLLFFIIFTVGVTKSLSSKYVFMYIIFCFFSVLIAIFFCRPRYQTMMRIVMIPFVAIGIETFYFFAKLKYHQLVGKFTLK